MNKNLKKFSHLLIAFIIVFSLTITSYAQTDTLPTTYKVTVNGNTVTLNEGEVIQIPLESIGDEKVSFPSDAGVLELYGEGKYVYYDIFMYKPATEFLGFMNIMNLTTGLSGGSPSVKGFSGRVPTSGQVNCMYSASLSGYAYLGTAPVAQVTSNYITWVCK